MSELVLHPALFQGQTIHTLTVDGRPAWIARQLGDLLGYTRGKRFVGKITLEWGDDFVLGKDYAILTGPELAAIKAQVPSLSPHAKGLLVLFESGLHMALVKTQMPLGRALRRFLVDEVLPQIVRTGAYATPQPAPPTDPLVLREVRLAARVDLDDRKFRASEMRSLADLLRVTRKIDSPTWTRLAIAACEVACGHALPALYAALEAWVEVDELAERIGCSTQRVLSAAGVLGLVDDRPGLCRPVPARDAVGRWTISFAFSAEAAAMIEGWILETGDDHPSESAA